MRAHEEYKNIFKSTFQYEHVWRIVKDSPMYAPQSSGHRSAKKARTSESSGAHTDSSNATPSVDTEYNEARSRPMGHKAAKKKGKERVTHVDQITEAMQQSVTQMDEYNNNKKVDQLIQAHKLLVMDTRDPTQNNRENIPEDTTSDPGEELFMTMVHNQHRAAEFIQTSYGNAQRRRSINREHVAGHIQLVNDYFSTEPVYTDDMFRRRFRMRKELFLRIVTDLQNHPDGYFKWREDAARRKGLSPLQKCTAAIRQLAYGGPADQLNEYLRMGETTALECLSNFCQYVMQIYGRVYLRKPNATDIPRLLEMHEQRHGFPGMLGSLDCMHWA
ncbi:uncharacterized protein LOC142514000 [Primulina tabacum]|uniref:uncharacterized protein LOC142514000 n=1 Tax=Primulina tabacum TaxID=48773 RepID=UPI003F5AC6BD